MAIYHFTARIVKRSHGKSAVAAAAYRAGEKYYSEREEKEWDYSNKAVVHSEIIAPPYAGEWTKDRAKLWNIVQDKERQWGNGQLARDLELALPRELSPQERQHVVREFARRNFVDKGMVADINIHEEKASDGGTNPHAHIMLTMKPIDPKTGELKTAKDRAWNKKALLKEWRENWAESVNDALEKKGLSERIDHRTLADQGIDRIPQIHVGFAAQDIEQKEGYSERYARNEAIKEQNRQAPDIRPQTVKDFWKTPNWKDSPKHETEPSQKARLERKASRQKAAQEYSKELKHQQQKKGYAENQAAKAKKQAFIAKKKADWSAGKDLKQKREKLPPVAGQKQLPTPRKKPEFKPPPKRQKSFVEGNRKAMQRGRYTANVITHQLDKAAYAIFKRNQSKAAFHQRQQRDALSISWNLQQQQRQKQQQRDDNKLWGLDLS